MTSTFDRYVELLVDGAPVARATGRCDERMHNESFDLNPYQGRSAVVRVVDASKSRWGHVNVDHFRWSWPARGFGAGAAPGPAATVEADVAGVAAAREGARPLFAIGGGHAGETKRAGAAYAFRRKAATSEHGFAACDGDKEDCVWEYMDRLLPSDRRAGDGFGFSVAVDDASGIALVGAPDAAATTHWKLAPPLRPVGRAPTRDDPTGWTRYLLDYETALGSPYVDRATPVKLPMDDTHRRKAARELRALGRDSVRAPSGAGAVWAQRARDVADGLEARPRHPAWDAAAAAGALYVFDRADAVVDTYDATLVPPRWGGLEVARLQPPGHWARSRFGASAALAGRALFGGAPGDDAFGDGAGAALVYDRDALRVSFLAAEFAVVEGRFEYATLTVVRDASYAERDVTVHYATEDLTARGVDDACYAACSGGAPNTAATSGCGDYRQAAGAVTIPAGATSAPFYVYIVDDPCVEVTEYLQVSLSVPGAPASQGEQFLAKLRIDDDDYPDLASSELCPDSGFV